MLNVTQNMPRLHRLNRVQSTYPVSLILHGLTRGGSKCYLARFYIEGSTRNSMLAKRTASSFDNFAHVKCAKQDKGGSELMSENRLEARTYMVLKALMRLQKILHKWRITVTIWRIWSSLLRNISFRFLHRASNTGGGRLRLYWHEKDTIKKKILIPPGNITSSLKTDGMSLNI